MNAINHEIICYNFVYHKVKNEGSKGMNKPELEALLEELDDALVKAFPGPEPMSVLVVGGACLLFQGVTTRPTEDVDVIIFEMMGSEESTLIFNSPVADKIRRIIKRIGKRHGFKGERQMFFNDDCSPFLLELSGNELPPMRLLKVYQKLHLYIPDDLRYILACKLMAGRPEKDLTDIEALRRTLGIQNRTQAQQVVNQYFPSPIHQTTYQLSRTLDRIFGK
jgi:Nucleotidyltransferase of unknown function (DUF6036)